MVRRPTARTLTTLVAVATLSAVAAGCGGRDDDARFAAAAERARTTTTTAAPIPAPGEPGTSSPSAPTATAPPDRATSLQAAVDAYRVAVGAPVAAKRLVVQLPADGAPYASLEYQVPGRPGAVDERAWRDGRVGQPEPVRLTPADDVPAELFDLDEVDWAAAGAALAAAPAQVEQQLGVPLEGSTGVTHVIVERNLPFSPDTVVRIYVDGGDRTTGGYVQLRADGSLDRVVA